MTLPFPTAVPPRGAAAWILLLALCGCGRDAGDQAAEPRAHALAQAPVRSFDSSAGPYQVAEIARGLAHPWAVAPLPGGDLLVSERGGTLRRIGTDGQVSAPLRGVPAVMARGQGGLLDVVPAPDFARSRRIYLSYAEPDGALSGTAVALATLSADGTALNDVRRIYQQQPKVDTENHFGSRLAFDGHGHLFVSQGERTLRPLAQQLDKLQGKLVRLNLDGGVPADNPFVGRGDARAEIWSYGHRNAQGLAFDPRTGTLWQSEHGPRGGDELNLPQPGGNYGWPLATDGIDYSGQPIAEAQGDRANGTAPPHHVWAKSPGLSGMAFLVGQPGSAWNDSLFLGSLAERNLIRLSLDGDRIAAEERLLGELGERVRDVRAGADGSLYVVTDEPEGKLLRLQPPRAQAR